MGTTLMPFNFDAFTIFWTFVSLLVSMTLHEMMHAFVGDRLGDDTARLEGRVSFNPLRHIDPLMTVVLPIMTLLLSGSIIAAAKPVPFNPARVKFEEFGAAMIAAAGPFTNLALAVLGGLLTHLSGANAQLYNVLTIFVGLNVTLFVFNLIPIPPLDGSRVLYAFAPEPLQNIMEQLEQYGIFIVFALVLFVAPFAQLLVNLTSSITLFLL